jgi:hypothetical protein
LVRRAFPELDLDHEPHDQMAAMGRVFGEELPPGLVFQEAAPSLVSPEHE